MDCIMGGYHDWIPTGNRMYYWTSTTTTEASKPSDCSCSVEERCAKCCMIRYVPKSAPTGAGREVKPSLHPQNITKTTWYYEHKNCIEIIHYPGESTPSTIRIPWWRLIRSLKRCKSTQTHDSMLKEREVKP